MISRRSILQVFAGSLAAVCVPLAKATGFAKPAQPPTTDDKITKAMRLLSAYGVTNFVVDEQMKSRLERMAWNHRMNLGRETYYGPTDGKLYFRGKEVLSSNNMDGKAVRTRG